MPKHVRRPTQLHWLTVAALLLGGCPAKQPAAVDPRDTRKAAPPKVETPEGPRIRPVSELLVKTGDYLPPLDEGRVEIARPEGWEVGARQKDYVVWFHRYKGAQTLPQIRVTVAEAPPDAPQNVTKENVEQFAEWLADHVKQQLNKEETLIEPVIPMIIGDVAVGRYVRKGRYREAFAEQHMLVTVQNGRLYALQQLLIKGDLETKPDIRDAAYAVMAGMKFSASGGTLTPGAGFQSPGEAPSP